MAASLEQDAEYALRDLTICSAVATAAATQFADAKLRFIRDARHAGWPWRRIGASMGQTDRAVQQYWERHRQRAGRL